MIVLSCCFLGDLAPTAVRELGFFFLRAKDSTVIGNARNDNFLRANPLLANGTVRSGDPRYEDFLCLQAIGSNVRRVDLGLRRRLVLHKTSIGARHFRLSSYLPNRRICRVLRLVDGKFRSYARRVHFSDVRYRSPSNDFDVQFPPKDSRSNGNKGRVSSVVVFRQDHRNFGLVRQIRRSRFLRRPFSDNSNTVSVTLGDVVRFARDQRSSKYGRPFEDDSDLFSGIGRGE